MKCRLIPADGAFEVVTPYMSSFVTELKSTIPANERSYNPDLKRWVVAAKHGQTVAAMIAKCFGQWIDVPAVKTVPKLGVIELLYLGRTKDRGNGERTAFGWTQDPGQLIGGWNVILPEAVLRAYFDPSYTERSAVSEPGSFYELLGIKTDASASDIKTGYRRMVRQWHPDVCKDPDAHNIFISIQKAYETLSNPRMKARYDVGLKMTAGIQIPKPQKTDQSDDYRAPLKCGNILCEFTLIGIRKTVTKIMQWEDIYNSAGQVLVSSWVMGDNAPTLEWR